MSNQYPVPEADLLRAYARSRSAEAFAELVRRYSRLVYGIGLRITANREDASDVAQESFLQLAAQASRITVPLAAWLHTVARSRAIDLVHRRTVRQTHERHIASPPSTGISPLEWEEISQRIDLAIAELPDDLRSLLIRRFIGAEPQAQLAEELGVDQGTVSRRIDKAVELLRNKLRQEGIDASAVAMNSALAHLASVEIPTSLHSSLVKIGLMPGAAAKATLGGLAIGKIAAAVLVIAAAIFTYELTLTSSDKKPSAMANTTQPGATSAPAAALPPVPPQQAVDSARVVRVNGQTYLPGAETMEWGNTTDQQNSVIAAATAALKISGTDVAFEQLMGWGASAFRVQVHDGLDISPASPFAQCGRDDLSPALAALGYSAEWIHTTSPDGTPFPDAIEAARTAIQESIAQGLPALGVSEECGLIVGYTDTGKLLWRPYSPKGPGYITRDKWPWSVGILHHTGQPLAPNLRLKIALQAAITMANTPMCTTPKQFSGEANSPDDRFYSGFAAYTEWAKRLRSGNLKDVLGNGYTWGSLSTARQMAGHFLRGEAQQYPPPLKDHLLAAGAQYERICDHMNQKRADLPQAWFLMPWDLKDGWKPEQQLAQAKVIDEIAEMEKQALIELQAALDMLQQQ